MMALRFGSSISSLLRPDRWLGDVKGGEHKSDAWFCSDAVNPSERVVRSNSCMFNRASKAAMMRDTEGSLTPSSLAAHRKLFSSATRTNMHIPSTMFIASSSLVTRAKPLRCPFDASMLMEYPVISFELARKKWIPC